MILIYSLTEIKQAAQQVYQCGKDKPVWAFHGEMGSGKTTFIHAVCDVLHVVSIVASPTYAIISEYKTAAGESIYHIDLYRLRDEEEALQAGVEECLNSGNRCFIEWAEKAPGLIPENCLNVTLRTISSTSREIAVQ